MGLGDLILFYVVTGISLRWIATAAAGGPGSILIWGLAWLTFFLPLVLSVVELSSRYPQEGGLYIWSKVAFGEFSGFMAAWTYWTSNLPYFPAVLYFAAGNALYLHGEHWQGLSENTPFFMIFSLLALALITALNVVGLNVGRWLHNLGALGMWLPIAVVMVLGIWSWMKFGSANPFTRASMIPSTHLKDVIFWSTIAFALGGSETASFMGEELKNARRDIPRALLIGGTLVTIGYIAGTFCVLLALPQSEINPLQGLIQAIARAGTRLGIAVVVPVSAVLIILSNVGAAGAFLAATARLPFVAGIDRFLPPAFGKLHPKWRTPYVALLTQAIAGGIFVFLGQAGTTVKGAYDVLVSMGVITYFIPYLFVFASMIALQREPAGGDVVRVPGGKPVAIVLALVGFATTSAAIVLSVIPAPDEANKPLAVLKIVGLTFLLIAIGVAIYINGRRPAANVG